MWSVKHEADSWSPFIADVINASNYTCTPTPKYVFVTCVPSRNEEAFVWKSIWSHAIKIKVKWSRYRPGVAQRVGRGIALLFHDRGTRRGWVVSSTPRPHFTPEKDPVPILQEAGWAPGPVWTGGKSRPHRDSIPDRPPCSQSLYRLSYWAHSHAINKGQK